MIQSYYVNHVDLSSGMLDQAPRDFYVKFHPQNRWKRLFIVIQEQLLFPSMDPNEVRSRPSRVKLREDKHSDFWTSFFAIDYSIGWK